MYRDLKGSNPLQIIIIIITISVYGVVLIKEDERTGLTSADVKGKGLALQTNMKLGPRGKVHSELDGE
jgi:hypothetical protein